MEFSSAVVTGAASGIGRALATRLASAGARLVLADVQAPALAEVAVQLGATAVPIDVADWAAVEALAGAAPDAQLVCLNAGIVGAALGALLLCGLAVTSGQLAWAVWGILVGGFIVLAHKDNIERLLAGTERKLGERAL